MGAISFPKSSISCYCCSLASDSNLCRRFLLLFHPLSNLNFFAAFSSISFAEPQHPYGLICNSREDSLINLLKTCSTVRDLDQIHAQTTQLGFSQNRYVVGKAIEFCSVSEHNLMGYAENLFNQLECPDGFLWNTMIRGFGNSRQPLKTFEYYNRMRLKEECADSFTLSFLLKACGQLGSSLMGQQVHCDAIKHGLKSHVFVSNTLINMYGILRQIEAARKLFEEMPNKDIVSWNSILTSLVRCGFDKEALEFYMRMIQCGIGPDEATLVVALTACSALGALNFGRWIHSFTNTTRIGEIISVSNSLIYMYSRCGAIGEAYQVFNGMKLKNTISWNTIILGLAMHSYSGEALTLFTRMLGENNAFPDELTVLAVLCACSHGGLVEEARRIFYNMSQDYNVEPTIKHYGCMVDLLGRAGFVEEAYWLVESMPMKCNTIILRTLLGACRVHGKIELGEKVRSRLWELEKYSSDYVLLANLYGSSGQWDEMARMRMSMKDGSVTKTKPGNSCISIESNEIRKVG